MQQASRVDGASDFDFVLGTWNVKNRRLVALLRGASEWYEFDAIATSRPIWGGAANVEEWDGAAPSGRVQGMAVRLYDPAAKHWSIYWASRKTGAMDSPVVGTFQGGRGELFGDDIFEGQPIRARVIWTSRTDDTCRWEQAFSADGGATWETNWIMEFTRQVSPTTGSAATQHAIDGGSQDRGNLGG